MRNAPRVAGVLASVLAGAAIAVACGSSGSAAPATPASTASAAVEISPAVSATVETVPVSHSGDAADDSAVWVDANDPSRSTIIGTDKKGGVVVYDLAGRILHEIPNGRMNNIDLRDGFRLAGRAVTLVAATKRDGDEIALYRVDPSTRGLVGVAVRPIELSIGAYGLCMYRSSKTGKFYVFVNSKRGEVEQWQLVASATKPGTVDARRVRAFDAGSQTEGCVADDSLRRLYVGEEDVGIWRYGAEPGAAAGRTKVASAGGSGPLQADVEGLTIAYGSDTSGYLIASSQGSSSYAVYRRGGRNGYVGSFEIVAGNGIGGVEETDGIDVTTVSLGPSFPNGVFVAQDGKNGPEHQNFKLVPWGAILRAP